MHNAFLWCAVYCTFVTHGGCPVQWCILLAELSAVVWWALTSTVVRLLSAGPVTLVGGDSFCCGPLLGSDWPMLVLLVILMSDPQDFPRCMSVLEMQGFYTFFPSLVELPLWKHLTTGGCSATNRSSQVFLAVSNCWFASRYALIRTNHPAGASAAESGCSVTACLLIDLTSENSIPPWQVATKYWKV